MAFGKFEHINLEEEKKKEEKTQKKRDEKMSRRGFIKGLIVGSATTAAFTVENKAEKLGKALGFMNKTFSRISEKMEKPEEPEEPEEVIEIEEKTSTAEKPEEKMEIKNIADHFLKAYLELEDDPNFFPKEVFTDDLLIAQQLQESNFDRHATSHAGAVGVMQNMPISIKDDCLFLEKLHNNSIINYQGPIYIGNLENELKGLQTGKYPDLQGDKRKDRIEYLKKLIPEKKKKFDKRILSTPQIETTKLLLQHNPDYSKALGKIYHMRLWHKDYGYSIGQSDVKKGNLQSAHIKLLGSYNAGPKASKIPFDKWKNYSWGKEPTIYVQKILNYMNRLKNIRSAMPDYELDSKDNAIAMRTAREMNKVFLSKDSKHTKKELLDKTMNHILSELQKAQNITGRKLTEDEVIEVFKQFEKVEWITDDRLYDKNESPRVATN